MREEGWKQNNERRRDGKLAKRREEKEDTVEKDFVKLSVRGLVEIGLMGGVTMGQGCHGSVPDGQAVSSQGVRGDVGLSGSLAGRDTSPCDWGGARVSERGQEWGDGGSGGVRWRPVWWGEKERVEREGVDGEGYMKEVNEGGGGEKLDMIRRELSKCECRRL